MKKINADETVLAKCMFFVSNRLSNILRRKAEKIFQELDIGVPYVYLLILVNQYDGITQTELGEKLDIAPSTCTRFVDKLVQEGVVRKEYDWKTAHVFITDKGREKCQGIDESLLKLKREYCEILGEEKAVELTQKIWNTCEALSK